MKCLICDDPAHTELECPFYEEVVQDIDYQQRRTAILIALALGLEVEQEDPGMVDQVPKLTGKQIEWIASWLASEGIGKVGG